MLPEIKSCMCGCHIPQFASTGTIPSSCLFMLPPLPNEVCALFRLALCIQNKHFMYSLRQKYVGCVACNPNPDYRLFKGVSLICHYFQRGPMNEENSRTRYPGVWIVRSTMRTATHGWTTHVVALLFLQNAVQSTTENSDTENSDLLGNSYFFAAPPFPR